MAWREVAKCVPVWGGMRWLHYRPSPEEPLTETCNLDDPDTFRGAVARLALSMGAPQEAVDEGVLFFLDDPNTGWRVSAGLRRDGKVHLDDFLWTNDDDLAFGVEDRRLALALAWKEHLNG